MAVAAFVLGIVLTWITLQLTLVASARLAAGTGYNVVLYKTLQAPAVWWFICLMFGSAAAGLVIAGASAIRYQMMLAFVASLMLSIISIDSLIIFAYSLRDFPLFGSLIRVVRDTAGAVLLVMFAGIALFVLIFFALSSGTIRYIERLNRAIHEIAGGNLAATVPERRSDELGQVAQNLGTMAQRLQVLMEQERNAEQTKYELITSVSHDLRTPLTSILGYLELVDTDKYVDEVELRHYVAIAHSKGRQLQRMIEQLFEYTRTSHGAVRVNRRPVNLAELLEQLAEEFVPQLQAAGATYSLELPREKITVSADPDLLVRVFENLISNAIRYGQGGAVIGVELALVDGQAVARVVNHGEPIPDADLARLFESFYRVEKSRSAATGGAGLGLAIARNIVSLHGGTITARNEPDRRIVFEVRLPVVASQQTGA